MDAHDPPGWFNVRPNIWLCAYTIILRVGSKGTLSFRICLIVIFAFPIRIIPIIGFSVGLTASAEIPIETPATIGI